MPIKHWIFLFLLPLAFILCSCCSNSSCDNGGIATRSCCQPPEPPYCCKVRSDKAIWELCSYGVQIIQVGDEVKMVLPSDRFFLCHTSVLNPCYEQILGKIAAFICCQEKLTIKITGYTDNCGCAFRNLALSRQQAQAIADFLWRAGIDARTLYAKGCGGYNPIACDNNCCGRYLNRRIEITWRKITDFYDY